MVRKDVPCLFLLLIVFAVLLPAAGSSMTRRTPLRSALGSTHASTASSGMGWIPLMRNQGGDVAKVTTCAGHVDRRG